MLSVRKNCLCENYQGILMLFYSAFSLIGTFHLCYRSRTTALSFANDRAAVRERQIKSSSEK